MSCEPLFSGEVQTIGLGKIELCVFDVFEPLEEQWRSLEADGICSIYQRYDWIEGWASNVAEPSRMQPRIAIGTSKGETLFIFPLGLRKRGPFSIATWLADSHSNFHMGLYAKEFLQRANSDDVRKVLDCITSNIGRIDILELCCQPVAWQGYTNPLTFLRWQESHNHAYALDLEPDFKTALNRKNGSRKRKKHRWQLNRLKDVGGPVLRTCASPKANPPILEIILNSANCNE